MNIILKWLTFTFAILITAYLLPNVMVTGVWAALWLALFIGVINVTIKPILVVLTLPINILTLGLFTFVINALMILLSASVIQGFYVAGFWWAMLFSFVLSIVSYALNKVFQVE